MSEKAARRSRTTRGNPDRRGGADVRCPTAQRRPQVSAGRCVPRGERMQREDFGVVFAGAVAEFGEGRLGPVAKLGAGERRRPIPPARRRLPSRCPRSSIRCFRCSRSLHCCPDSEARPISGATANEACSESGDQPADAVANGGVGHLRGTPCMHRSQRLVDRVGDSSGAMGGRGSGAVVSGHRYSPALPSQNASSRS